MSKITGILENDKEKNEKKDGKIKGMTKEKLSNKEEEEVRLVESIQRDMLDVLVRHIRENRKNEDKMAVDKVKGVTREEYRYEMKNKMRQMNEVKN